MKMLMFGDQLEYDGETVAKLKRLNIFLALFYIPMWMLSQSAADAPVNELRATQKPDNFRRRKPLFPLVTSKTALVDLIGPESHIPSIGLDWLLDPVEAWPKNDDYKKAVEYVTNLKVVNDVAERGVKIMSNFANVITTDPKQGEYLLQAVEYNRRRFVGVKEETLNKLL